MVRRNSVRDGERRRVPLADAPVRPSYLYGSKEYQEQAEELIAMSAALTDKQKMISEYWSDGPNSEQPPGHWALFARFVSARDHHPHPRQSSTAGGLEVVSADVSLSRRLKRKGYFAHH